MKSFHELRLDAIDSIDSKAYSLLSATGIIASFYIGFSAFIIDNYIENNLFNIWSIFFISAISLIILTAIFCTKAIQIAYIYYGSDPAWLSGLNKLDKEKILLELIKDYKGNEEDNSKTSEKKAFWIKYAVYSLTFGIYTIILSSIILLSMTFEFNYFLVILFLMTITLLYYSILITLEIMEKTHVKKYA